MFKDSKTQQDFASSFDLRQDSLITFSIIEVHFVISQLWTWQTKAGCNYYSNKQVPLLNLMLYSSTPILYLHVAANPDNYISGTISEEDHWIRRWLKLGTKLQHEVLYIQSIRDANIGFIYLKNVNNSYITT